MVQRGVAPLLSPEFRAHARASDEPRDLGLVEQHHPLIYSVRRDVAGLRPPEDSFRAHPFQYVLTTTTPPPHAANSKRHLILRLDASQEAGLLFRRDLSRPPNEEQLPLLEA